MFGLHVAPALAAVHCVGDCDGNGSVSVNELLSGVRIALVQSATECTALDIDADGSITIAELIAAVAAAVSGCSWEPSPTPTRNQRHVYAIDQGAISVIDIETGVSTATIPNVVGCGIAIAGTKAYIAQCGGTAVAVVDTHSNSVVGTVSVPCCSTSSITAASDGTAVHLLGDDLGRFFITQIDTRSDRAVRSVTIPGAPRDIAVAHEAAYAVGQGTVSVIDLTSGEIEGTIPEVVGCGIAVSGPNAYVAQCGGTSVIVIDTQSSSVTGAVSVPCCSHAAISAAADGTSVYLLGDDLRYFFVTEIGTAADEAVRSISIGGAPQDISVLD